jgi:hypothetical protein
MLVIAAAAAMMAVAASPFIPAQAEFPDGLLEWRNG